MAGFHVCFPKLFSGTILKDMLFSFRCNLLCSFPSDAISYALFLQLQSPVTLEVDILFLLQGRYVDCVGT